MRLIDADALELELDENNAMNGVLFVVRKQGGGRTIAMVQSALKKMLENAPTIDAVPVVHARWASILIPRRYGGCVIECSKCYNRGNKNYSFCPSCGAKMDEKEDGAR